MINRDKIAGALYGVALGDALGRPTEFMRLGEIHRRYGRYGYMRLPYPALFTDDTQLTLAVARAIDSAAWLMPRELVRTLTNEYVRWARDDPSRAPGISCMTSVRNLARARTHHRSWTTAPVLSSGCGANMRVAPVALLYTTDQAVNVAHLQAALTHAHPVALAASELTALAIRWSAEGMDPDDLPQALYARACTQRDAGTYRVEWLGRLHERWVGELPRFAYSRDVVDRVLCTARMGPEAAMSAAWSVMIRKLDNLLFTLHLPVQRVVDSCKMLGGGWVADEALMNGLYHAVTHRSDPVRAISSAARTSGDSDSVACIAGAVAGAYHGALAAWPSDWMARIERREDIETAVDALTARHPLLVG